MRLWGLLVVLALVGMGLPTPLRADSPLTITGQVRNGTPGASPPVGLEVTLQVMRGGETILERTARTDAEGRFTFTQVPEGEGLRYFVWTRYQEAPYLVELTSPRTPLTLEVFETTTSLEAIRVVDNTVVFLGADPGQGALGVLEAVRLENRGDRTFVTDLAQAGPTTLLRFSLPAGAQDLEVETTLQGGHLVQMEQGFALTTPVPPGTHDLLFTYRVPYRGEALAITHTLPLGAATFRLLVVEGLGEVSAPALEDRGLVALGEVRYRMWEREGLAPGTQVEFTLTSLPQPPLPLRMWRRLTEGGYTRLGVPVLTGAALAALLVYGLWGRRAPLPAPTPPEGQGPQERQALLAALAHLDDLFEQGRLEEGAYRQRRAELKARLAALGMTERGPDPGRQGPEPR